jgi:hypothetical protein
MDDRDGCFENKDVTCFVILDVIISFFVNGERAEPERGLITVKNWKTHTASLVVFGSCTRRR